MIKKISVYALIFLALAVLVSCKDGKPLELKKTPPPQRDSGLDTAGADLSGGDAENPVGGDPVDPGGEDGGPTPVSPGEDIPSSVPEPDYTNSIGIKFVSIPSGEFYGGSCKDAAECKPGMSVDNSAGDDELPQYHARINAFKMGIYEVTLGQFKQFIDAESKQELLTSSFNDHNNHGDNAPVVVVSWNDIHEFIGWLNRKESLSGNARYRLPTEAEWEYAARAGTKTVFFWGDDEGESNAVKYSWYYHGASESIHEVGNKLSNPWGLYDIYGNVVEVVSDWYEEDYYQSINGVGDNPKGNSKQQIKDRYVWKDKYCEMVPVTSSSNPCHISRGGSYYYGVDHMRSARRNTFGGDDTKFNDLGFRLVKGN